MTTPIENQNSKIENLDDTGLPLLRTWPIVYAAVLILFVLVVLALTLFTRIYS